MKACGTCEEAVEFEIREMELRELEMHAQESERRESSPDVEILEKVPGVEKAPSKRVVSEESKVFLFS